MMDKEGLEELYRKHSDIDLVCLTNYLDGLMLENYNPVISDNVITLSIPYKRDIENINAYMFQTFTIVANQDKTNVGCISFDYYSDEKDKYNVGNVTYMIDKKFQNKGYATRALKLLVQLLKNNNYKGDKDLYFWVGYYNQYSKKVILNNGGEIISGGDVEKKTPYMLRIKI